MCLVFFAGGVVVAGGGDDYDGVDEDNSDVLMVMILSTNTIMTMILKTMVMMGATLILV